MFSVRTDGFLECIAPVTILAGAARWEKGDRGIYILIKLAELEILCSKVMDFLRRSIDKGRSML